MEYTITQLLSETESVVQTILESDELQQMVAANGFSRERIEVGLSQVKVVRECIAINEYLVATLNQTDHQRKADWQWAQQCYEEYADLTREAYQREPEVLRKLKLDQPTPHHTEGWLDQARHFYTKIPAFNAKLEERFGLKPEDWSEALVGIHSLISYNTERLQQLSGAQAAAAQCEQELQKLRSWFWELQSSTNQILEQEPQLLAE